MVLSYQDTINRTMALYRQQAFDHAYALLTEQGAAFPDEAPIILYLRSCLAARLQQPDLAIALLQEAIDRGYWYNDTIMRESPSWQSLQGLPAFERLAEVCYARQDTAQRDTRAHHLVVTPDRAPLSERPYPLLIALHGNGDNARTALHNWGGLAENGWLVAALQSSQVVSTEAYVWDDQARAERDIADQYTQLRTVYPIDRERVVLAGFSMGAETALRLALTQAVPVQGFVLLAPGGPTMAEPNAWRPEVQRATAQLRGAVLLCERDEGIAHATIHEIVGLLNAHHIACELAIVPEVDHEYPPNLSTLAQRAVDFIYPLE